VKVETGRRVAPRGAPGEVRIIGGTWKRSKLPVLDREGLRPTPDRVRETLFNWLGQRLEGWRVLDAFAGTGALGFEAASRGAASVVCVERDAQLVGALLAAKQRLGADALRVEAADALTWMARAPRAAFELVLLDPPFADRVHAKAIQRALPLVCEGGLLYVEAGERLEAPVGAVEHRHSRAGQVHAHLWRRDAGAVDTLPAPDREPENS
jgi:16S rRNA (guanine966-N2)-methyltransferase